MSPDHLRIAFVTYELGLGGSTTFLLNLCTEFRTHQIQHLVMGLNSHQVSQEEFAAAQINVWCPNTNPRSCEDGFRSALEQLRQFSPTHILGCLGPQSLEILRYVPAGICRIGVAQTDDNPTYASLVSYARFLDATVGVSQHASAVLRRAPRLAAKPVYYQPHGVPPSLRSGRLASTPDSPIRIIYVGRLFREQKRVHLFPRILQSLIASHRPFVWTIVGDGPELKRLQQTMATTVPHQTVVFAGQVPYHRVPQLLADSDIFLLTSDYEGLPLSLLEALVSGAVPVASDLDSGIREAIGTDTGVLIEPDDIAGYATAILRLDADRALLAKMSLAAMELAKKRFSCEAMANRWIQMFSELPGKSAQWDVTPKIENAIGMRMLGLRFIPAFRPIGDGIDFLRGWRF
jgi:glycosyltransferase involved in cell wall biosynthesis